MELIRDILLGYAKTFAAALPVFLKFLVILFIGWIIAKLVSKAIKKLLEKINVGKILDKIGFNELTDGKDLSNSIINVISKFVYYFIFLIFLSTAVESLGMQVLTDLIASLIEFFPKILIAVIIFVIGFYIANLIRGIILSATRSIGMASGGIIASIVFYFILIMISVTAIEQMNIDASLITDNISILIGGMIIAGALAYGLSAVDVMGNILSVFFAKKTFAVGQYIRIGDVEGQIVEISSVNITIAQKGKRIIIPAKSFTKENVIISVNEVQEIEDGKTVKKSGSNLNFLFIVGLILAIAIIIFAIQNGNNTEIDFFIWKITPGPPLALLIILCVAIGAVLALLFSIPGRWRRRKKRIQLESELSTLRKNYEELAGINKPKSNTP